MKINELTGYKNDPYYQKAVELFKDNTITTSKKLTEFSNYMQQQGFQILGSGMLGLAFEKPGYPWVFKIFHDDMGYLHYFNYAKQNQNNPHVPRTKGGALKLTTDPASGTLYLVRIEKLSPLPDNMKQLPIIQAITSIEWGADDMKEKIKINKLQSKTVEQIIHNYSPQLLSVIKACNNSGYNTDFHSGNIMMRNNTIVISDPLVG